MISPPPRTCTSQPAFLRNGRVPSLDGLRGIAILLVLFDHCSHSLPTAFAPAMMFFGNGALGVQIFFLLSGFLIYTLSAREIEATNTFNWTHFYWRRMLRIFPCFYFYVIVIVVLVSLGALTVTKSMLLSAGTFSLNYRVFWEGQPSGTNDNFVMGHYWTLALEEQFYLIWPILMVLLVKGNLRFVLIGAIVLAPLIRVGSYFLFPASRGALGMMFHTAYDSIAAGVLLGNLFRQDSALSILKKVVANNWVLVGAFVFVFFLSPILWSIFRGAYALPFGFTLQLCGLVILISAAILRDESALFRWLNSSHLIFVGTLSYSLYIWNNLFLRPGGDWAVNFFPINILCLFAIATVSYYLVERPVLRLAHKKQASFRA